MSRSAGAVVVGVDGSVAALRAVRAGAAEAELRGRPLRLVHAFIWPLLRVAGSPPPDGPAEGGLRHQAERTLAAAVDEARAARPAVPIEAEVVDGQASAVLCREAADATMVVIGDRGLGGFTSLLVGSVAIQVGSYARCPVLVVRGEERSTGPVVVGVDGSALSERAVAFAAEEASLLGTELLAVHAYRHPVSTGPGDMLPLVHDEEQLRAQEERALAESVAGVAGRHPGLSPRTRLVRGRAAPSLIEASRQARLVVVGALGRGGFAGLVLGSVSQAVLHHADCPVVVVRRTNAAGQDG